MTSPRASADGKRITKIAGIFTRTTRATHPAAQHWDVVRRVDVARRAGREFDYMPVSIDYLRSKEG